MLLPNEAYHLDGTWKISLPLLLKHRQDTMRPDKWLLSSQDKRSQYPSEVAEVCSTTLLSGQLTPQTEWITAFDALALLTYSKDSYRNKQLVAEITQKTDLKLPVKSHFSSYEQAFGADLAKLLSDWWNSGKKTHYETFSQKHFERYFVDFFVITQDFSRGPDDITKEFIVIEFDEDAHKRTDYRLRDEAKDEWFRVNKPDHKIIRVRHEHQDDWLEAVRTLGRLVSLDSCYAQCLWTASTDTSKSRHELLINSQSSRLAYDKNANDCSFLLKQPERRLPELKGILKQLGIEVTREDEKIVRFKRRDVEKYL